MKPDLGHTLATAGFTLIGEISPHLAGSYREGSVNTIGAMMLMASVEQERAADNAVQAIEDMRALFREVAGGVPEDLGSRLQDAAARETENYLVSTLTAHRSDLQKLLIALQAHAETLPAQEQALRKRIWQVLERDADRNMMNLG